MSELTDLAQNVQTLVNVIESLDVDFTAVDGISVVGNPASSTAVATSITASGNGLLLGTDAGELGFIQLTGSMIPNDVISNEMLRNSQALSVVGRATNSSGDPADITGSNNTVLAISGSTVAFVSTLPAVSGVNLTALNASNLGSGTVPDARFPSTLPAMDGSALTHLNASNLSSGTVPDGRFPSTLPAVNGSALTSLTAANLTGSLPAISGASLTNLTAANVTGSHTLPDGVLSTNVPLLNAVNTFTSVMTLQSAAQPLFQLVSTGASTNSKTWEIYAYSDNTLNFRAANDAYSAFTTWLQVTRSGTTISNLGLVATTATLTGDLVTTGQVNAAGQIRAKAWYTSGSGAAAEVGIASGLAYFLGYNRTSSAYIDTHLTGANIVIEAVGASSVTMTAASTTVTTATSSGLNVNQGYIFAAGKEAIRSVDTWLRLNNGGDFTSGVYIPNTLRVDGGINLSGGPTIQYASGFTYGSIKVGGYNQNGYTGIVVDDGGYISPTLMSGGNGGAAGVYMQSDTKWAFYCYDGTSVINIGYSTMQDAGTTGAYVRHNSSSYQSGIITVSSSSPSGGSNGDIWFKV